jgi:hypothetical protein
MSFTSVDFPDPETPVTATSVPSGIEASIWRKLLARAPRTTSAAPLPRREISGTGMRRRPDKY